MQGDSSGANIQLVKGGDGALLLDGGAMLASFCVPETHISSQ